MLIAMVVALSQKRSVQARERLMWLAVRICLQVKRGWKMGHYGLCYHLSVYLSRTEILLFEL